MKKLLAILLCGLMLASFAACGSSDSENSEAVDNNDAAVEDTADKAEAYDYNVGEFTVKLPSGWQAFTLNDMDGNTDTNSVDVVKGDSVFGGFAYARIDYYGPETTMMKLSSEIYENVEEIAEFELGGYTWSGFKCTSFDMPLINLQSAEGDHEFQLALWCEQENSSFTLEDADVKALIESLTPNA